MLHHYLSAVFTRIVHSVLFTACCLVSPFLSHSQTLKEERIGKLPKGFDKVNPRHMYVDAQGHYCFAATLNGKHYLITESDTLGPFQGMSSMADPAKGSIDLFYSGNAADVSSDWYYRSGRGTQLFGPVRGKLVDYTTGTGSNSAAVITSSGDSMNFDINGSRVYSIPAAEARSSYQNWCAFNNRGDRLYFTARKGDNHLYFNGKEVASVTNGEIMQPVLLDNGDFIYRVMRPEPVAASKSSGQTVLASSVSGASPSRNTYFLHYHRAGKESVIGPFASMPSGGFISNGGLLFFGEQNVSQSTGLAVSGKYLPDVTVPQAAPKLLAGSQHYLVPFTRKGKNYLLYNGKEYEFNFNEIQLPSIDTIGNIAFYKRINGKLYRCPHITAQNEVIPEFGQQPVPIDITPAALATYYVNVGGAGHLFQNGALIISAPGPIEILNTSEVLNSESDPENKFMPGNLHIINGGGQSFFLYKGQLSEPSIRAEKQVLKRDTFGFIVPERPDPGAIVAGEQTRNGFFVIQKRSIDRYWLNVNNRVYKLLEGIQEVIPGSGSFDGNNLVFYVRKEDGLYRYSLGN